MCLGVLALEYFGFSDWYLLDIQAEYWALGWLTMGILILITPDITVE